MSNVRQTIGQRVRRHRTERGLTQRELAGRASLSPRYLLQLEAGEANVSVDRLVEVARALEVSLVTLLAGLGPVADPADRAAARARLDPTVLEQLLPPKIALIGLRGAGKSTLGEALAERLGCPFVRLDERVGLRAGMRLGEIFEYHGAERYRELCIEALDALLDEPGAAVVEIGGSVVLDPIAWDTLRRRFRLVWLRATPEEHLRRVAAQGDTRPMDGHADALATIRTILAAREPLYAQAPVHLDTESLDLTDSVAHLVAALSLPPSTDLG